MRRMVDGRRRVKAGEVVRKQEDSDGTDEDADEWRSERGDSEDEESDGEHGSENASRDDDELEDEGEDQGEDQENPEESEDDCSSSETDEIDGGDLRRAGEYGYALLELLQKESQRGKILSELLDREQKLNQELVQKQQDISRLKRRATYQQTHLEHLEEQAADLEQSLSTQRNQAAEEKRRRSALEREVNKLRQLLAESGKNLPRSSFDSSKRAFGSLVDGESVASSSTSTPTKDVRGIREKFAELNQISPLRSEGGLSPARLPLKKLLASRAAFVGRQMSEALSVQVDAKEASAEKAKKCQGVEAALYVDPSQYEEIRVMYEEERERRQELQKELEALLEDCELAKHEQESESKQRQLLGPSGTPKLEPPQRQLDFRTLCNELGYKQSNRRATVGKCELFCDPSFRQRARELVLANDSLLVGVESPTRIEPFVPPRIVCDEERDELCSSYSCVSSFKGFSPVSTPYGLTPASTPKVPECMAEEEEGDGDDDDDGEEAKKKSTTTSATDSQDCLGTYVENPASQVRRLAVRTLQGEGENFTTYVIMAARPRGGWRFVQTRFKHFERIYQWQLQHYCGGLLTCEPFKVPKPKRGFFGLVSKGSLNVSNVRRRKVWLEHSLMAVQQQVPALVDVLLDFIGRA